MGLPAEGAVGAVMVVGAGVSGIQAALDLAEAGFKVYLVEKQPAIGGKMAQLDKTFPTNDCSMCTLAPRLVECGRHPNITVLTCAEVMEVRGHAGNFSVRVRQHARFVDPLKCKGCGDCEAACPVEVEDEFNQGLGRRKAIYRPFPQAVPNIFVIDIDHCLECVECEEACATGAISPYMGDREWWVQVGALVLCPGYRLFDATRYPGLGFGRYADVITSLQFERLLSASGPYQGRLVRPSDGAMPRSIAFVQCVGSRDMARGFEYCSGVCCMYSIKQALLAREQIPGVDAALFVMDVRAYGKDFDKYYERAKRAGVRFIRCKISQVEPAPGGNRLLIRYCTPDEQCHTEEFDLVVLAVGFCPPAEAQQLAWVTGIELDAYGFAKTWDFYPGATTRAGIFVAGAFCGPKDIPESVVDASCAASHASRLLSAVRGTMTVAKHYPPPRPLNGKEPRIGVFVCHCGNNIGRVVDVPEVVRYAGRLPGVVHSREQLFACAQDGIAAITEAIQEYDLNRVVVASCTPRTHAPLFQESLRQAGLNPYLLEFVNLREQCAWVHADEPDKATAKARDLVRMGVRKAALLYPVDTYPVELHPRALVVGGGAAGMTAALTIADQGFPVCLVEREGVLGGNLRRAHFWLEGTDHQAFLYDLTLRVEGHPLIEVLTGTEIEAVEGYVGNYVTRLRQGDLVKEVRHGVAVLATGGVELRPAEYLYGQHPQVLTQTELEKRLATGRTANLRRVVMIQCVGSRQEGRPYCSRVCCLHAIKNAIKIKETVAGATVLVLYRDIQAYGFGEKYYREACRKGVIFMRYGLANRPVVEPDGDGLKVTVSDPVAGTRLTIPADVVVLSTAIVPHPSTERMASLFRVPLTPDGFYAEAHVKLRPVDFAGDGLFLAGLGHAPKTLRESLIQAHAVGIRAVALLSKGRLEGLGSVVRIEENRCSGCGICREICPNGAIYLDEERKTAHVIEAVCRGCGACVAACPSAAARQNTFDDGQIMAMIEAAFAAQAV